MASVFKRGRWVDAQGRKCLKETPEATWQESRFWMVKVYLDGKPKLVKGYTDKAASEQLGAKLERAKAQGEQGLIDPYKVHRKRALAEHVADWTAELRQLGRDAVYVTNCEAQMQRLAGDCGWATLDAMTADSFIRWRETAHARSPRTLNHYLATLTTFSQWAIKRKRMASNPVADVEKVDETGDVRRARRALTADELARLLDAVPGHYRLAYHMLMTTGLRRGELLALRWGDVRLNTPYPCIQLRAEATKAKRADVVPLRADLADLLRRARGEAGDNEPVVATLPTIPTHRKFLAAAKIAWQDDAGRRADIHALRHSFGTLLSKSGVAPREAMSLMRHTDLRLTMRTYTDPRTFDLAGAVEKLPSMTKPTEPQAARATGTDGRDEADSGRTFCVTYPSAGLGSRSAVIGGHDDDGGRTVSVGTGGNWQQKTPSGEKGVNVRAIGVEPTRGG